MTEPRTVWDALLSLRGLFAPIQTPVVVAALEATGMNGRPLGMLLHAHDLAPRPLTPESLSECTPYYRETVFLERMEDLTAHGFLQRTGPKAFFLTEKGRAAADAVNRTAWESLGALRPLPEADLARMTTILAKLVTAAEKNPATPKCPCLGDQAKPPYTHAQSYLGWVSRCIGDLYRYKCDCHTTAWRPLGVSGFAMEPFTLIWRDGVATLPALIERVGQERMGRGHSESDYAAFVEELVTLGWVAIDRAAGTFALTADGRAVRERVEAQTDAAFYGIWADLAPGELDDLAALTEALAAAMKVMT